MTDVAVGGLGFAALIALILLRIPIGAALAAVGGVGYAALIGTGPLLAHLKTSLYAVFADHGFSVVPLFLLMGAFAARAGISAGLFRCAAAWIGHRPGGLAMASIAACAGFGAVCGSSLATAAAMGRVALPEMRRLGYAPGFASGAVAAGGTLGILIPPSVVLVVYALIAEQSVGKLFAAAIIPGLIAAAGYALVAWIVARRRPDLAPAAARLPWRARWAPSIGVAPALAVFALAVGGLQLGWFTPTEGAAVGAGATLLLGVAGRRLSWADIRGALLETAETTGMIFYILLGAGLFNSFLSLTGAPRALADWAIGLNASPYLVLAAILALYVALGCVKDSLSTMLVTLPVTLPIIMGLEFGLAPEAKLVWFGILALMTVEIGLITPPVGMNIYVVQSISRDATAEMIFRGVAPYLLSDALRILLLVAVPAISLWAPGLL